jgi:hypothetical protein
MSFQLLSDQQQGSSGGGPTSLRAGSQGEMRAGSQGEMRACTDDIQF